MCLIIFAHQALDRYPLVVAANRDEFFTRETAEAAFWSSDHPDVLGGRDLLAGGTWLGLSRQGRFAAVTNIRDPSQLEVKPRSRGELTREFLTGAQSARDYCRDLEQHFDDYAGYNLLVSDGRDLCYVNNLHGRIEVLEPGIYGLSNGLLNNDWPKVRRGRERLASLLEQPELLKTDALLGLMADRQPASDDELPDTGVPLELERKLSSAFIHNPERLYGTRCSSAVILSAEGRHRFSERNFDDQGETGSSHYFQFDSPALAASH